MEIGPIWRAMQRAKTSYILIALQIAVTMAIMANAISIIQERSAQMARPSGIDEANIFHMTSLVFDPDADSAALMRADVEAIRNHPGVVNAVATNSVPLSNSGWSQKLQLEPGEGKDSTSSAVYFVDEHGIDAFGVELVAGRNFDPTEVVRAGQDKSGWPPLGIATVALAEEMFPGEPYESILGKTVYVDTFEPVTIVGVIERMQAAWVGWGPLERSVLMPMVRNESFTRYVVRAEPGYRDQVMPEIEEMLAARSADRLTRNMRTMEDTRRRGYTQDSAMVKMLVFIVITLTSITGLGIVGLASFSVARRSKQIGTRRALGATRLAILRYFMLENFLVSSAGVAAGAMLAVAINIWMVESFGMQRMPWYLVPSAMLALWLVGQAAVYGPARRATRISPAMATRTT